MSRRFAAAVALAVLTGLCVAACSSDSSAGGPGTAPTPSVVDGKDISAALEVVVQRSVTAERALVDAAKQLSATVAPTCPSAWTATRAAWRAARIAWDAAAVYSFKPQEDASLAANVDYWPVDSAGVDDAGEGTEPMSADDLESLGAPLKGLPAVEVLIFGDAAPTTRRCSYVHRIADAIRARATIVGDELQAAAPVIAGADGALVDILSMLADSVYAVCDKQLGMPSGNTAAAGPPDLSLVREGGGAMAVADVRAQLAEVREAYSGGIQPIVVARFKDSPDPMQPIFAQTEAALAPLGDSLSTAITKQSDEVAFATEQCRSVRRTFSTNVAGLLGVTITLPIGDGD